MSDIAFPRRIDRVFGALNILFLIAALIVIAAILTTAMVLQFAYGELPCPLCLLERLALFGVAFGIILSLRRGFSYQNTGISLLFTILLLVVATRQTLLDIYPRPGHAYIGTAVLGLHMPVWSIVIALAILTAYALRLTLLGADPRLPSEGAAAFPAFARIASGVSLAIILLCLINTVAVVIQCGFSECHTFGYKLLE
jgi:disulfide bond formation protein DsbB